VCAGHTLDSIARRHYWRQHKKKHFKAWLEFLYWVGENRRYLAYIYRQSIATIHFHRYLNSYRAHTYVRDQWLRFMELERRRRELWGHVFMLVAEVHTHNSAAGRWRQYKYAHRAELRMLGCPVVGIDARGCTWTGH